MAGSLENLCVFCGSGFGIDPSYRIRTAELGRYLCGRGINLVYGGSGVGLMGELARTVLEGGGKVTGVIPESIKVKVPHLEVTELIVVETMHERKAAMYELSDGFLALPGGIGTMDEFFETYTWSQLGYHRKPVGLYNLEGYYDRLVEFLDHSVEEGFLKPSHRASLIVDSDPERMIASMESFVPITDWKLADDVPAGKTGAV